MMDLNTDAIEIFESLICATLQLQSRTAFVVVYRKTLSSYFVKFSNSSFKLVRV